MSNENQIENPLISQISGELSSLNKKKEDVSEYTPIKKGTNRLLWNTPYYSAVGIDLNDTETENPNAYWKKWAEEQEKTNNTIK